MFKTLLSLLILVSPHVMAEWAPELPVGSKFPTFAAEDQTKQKWTNTSLIGSNGLVLFFNRSTSW
jgi:hypothetical protein